MPTTDYFTANGMLLGEQTNGLNIDYVPDALGSVVAAVDQNLNTTYTAAYKPYGDVLASTGAAPNFTWVGTLGYLAAAGRAYAENAVRRRIVSTKLGRWTSVDPLWPNTAAYLYGNQTPVLQTDASGLISCCSHGQRTNTISATFTSFSVGKAVCQCQKGASGQINLKIYKPVSYTCVAEKYNMCNCSVTQEACGFATNNGVSQFSNLPLCPVTITDVGPNTVCAKASTCLYTSNGDINTLYMKGEDAPGMKGVIALPPPCPDLNTIGFGTFNLPVHANWNVSFWTGCGCPPGVGISTWKQWGFQFTVDITSPNGPAVWGGECAGTRPHAVDEPHPFDARRLRNVGGTVRADDVFVRYRSVRSF